MLTINNLRIKTQKLKKSLYQKRKNVNIFNMILHWDLVL